MLPLDQTAGVQSIAQQAGTLTVALAEVSGHIDNIDSSLIKNADSVRSISDLVLQMAAQNGDVQLGAITAQAATAQSRAAVDLGRARIETTLHHIAGLVGDVSGLGDGIASLRDSLSEVSRVASEILDIARTTNLLAINASIEAARAGPEGKGFMVVAQEIKLLSGRTETAINSISERLEVLNSENKSLGQKSFAAMDRSSTLQEDAASLSQVMSQIVETTAQVDAQQARIRQASQIAISGVDKIVHDIQVLERGIDCAAVDLHSTRRQIGGLIPLGEGLVATCAGMGVQTVDSPFIAAVIAAAAAITAAFDGAILAGTASAEQFFDPRTRPIAGSDPAQIMTPFTQITDALLPAIIEPVLSLSPRIVFCAAVDTRGYLPTHNAKFSHAQRPQDPGWNAAHCRNRRIFDDRVGLAAGRSPAPFLLQAYRRDMGGGKFVMMKDVSAPIYVGGTHWGGLRLAFTA